jgi:hypothetical protein
VDKMIGRKPGANMLSKLLKPKVVKIQGDGLFATVEFNHSCGERVSGIFWILAWVHEPEEMLNDTKIVMERGYFSLNDPDFSTLVKKRKKRESERLWAYSSTKLRKLKRPKVIEVDDLFAVIEFTQDNGERVSAEFRRCGWVIAPGFVIAEVQKSLARGYRTITGPRITIR